ncbi:CaiB/BaiF CoA transferase family protein [Streptomyces hydrogenans]|uniref:CaiB/BaiF CoA transferase family protein n=1 Tax=Streptomyces hydrogenans TaxID=1873719 RepID=UPI003D7651A8
MTDIHPPLAGIRVLDVSTVLAAPVTATFLGDFGADVVKVEEPGRGDFTRGGAGQEAPGKRSLQWVQEGRNKKSVTIDLRTERGQALLRDLVPHFDVVVTNYRPPTLEKWGLGPDALRALNPRAVLVFLTGYGLTGPYRGRGAFDRIASAFSGLTYVSGDPDRPPVRSGYSVIDYMAAYMAAFATMTALYHRDLHGGEGQIIDLALYEAGFRACENALISYSATGEVRERLGNRNPFIAPASDFDTADGRRVSVHAGTDPLFRRLVHAMGRPELTEDERFADRADRLRHQEELYEIVAAWAATLPADDLVTLLNDAGIPSAPLMNVADIAADRHYRERGTITEVHDEHHGDLLMAAPLPHLSGTPGSIRSLGAALGEHTDEVLSGLLGLDAAALAELRADGVV